MKIIILEGIDNCGKTTTRDLLNKKTNYKYCVIDRMLGSCFVYSKLRARGRSQEFLELEENLDSNIFFLVYLYCDRKDVLNRQKKKLDDDIHEKDIDKLNKYYHEYLTKTHLKTLTINTSKTSPDNVVDKIITWIDNENN